MQLWQYPPFMAILLWPLNMIYFLAFASMLIGHLERVFGDSFSGTQLWVPLPFWGQPLVLRSTSWRNLHNLPIVRSTLMGSSSGSLILSPELSLSQTLGFYWWLLVVVACFCDLGLDWYALVPAGRCERPDELIWGELVVLWDRNVFLVDWLPRIDLEIVLPVSLKARLSW